MRLKNLLGASSALGTGKKRIAATISLVMITGTFALVAAPAASAETGPNIDFEAPLYTLGNINGQDGWLKTGAYDVEVDGSAGYATFGDQSLRISNAVTSGAFGDQTYSKPLVDEAGETSAANDSMSGGTRQTRFVAEWDFASVTSAAQPGLSTVVSPDRGDGARMSWVQMTDTGGAGLEVNFNDYQTGTGFVQTNIATGLSRTAVHTIKLQMDFVDGVANDVVKVHVDGALVHTGTSWEDYFRDEESNPTRTVDSLLFRVGGAAVPATAGEGFLIDNVNLESGGPIAPSLGECLVSVTGSNPTTYTLLADCTTPETIVVPQHAGGTIFDGDNYSITGVDPVGGHFKGAVVQAEAGSNQMTVKNTTVQTSNLQTACDGGVDRLRGILFDGAHGLIDNNVVTNIEQGANGDGCQEGNAIEARNAPFDKTGTNDLAVLITNNEVTQYQKSGIVANGSVAATITNNVVTGDGPITFIAQNGIQVGFGATAVVKSNTSSGNNYTPKSDLACGFLIYQADGVRASGNNFFNNERNQCNFGKGGGSFEPSTP